MLKSGSNTELHYVRMILELYSQFNFTSSFNISQYEYNNRKTHIYLNHRQTGCQYVSVLSLVENYLVL